MPCHVVHTKCTSYYIRVYCRLLSQWALVALQLLCKRALHHNKYPACRDVNNKTYRTRPAPVTERFCQTALLTLGPRLECPKLRAPLDTMAAYNFLEEDMSTSLMLRSKDIIQFCRLLQNNANLALFFEFLSC